MKRLQQKVYFLSEGQKPSNLGPSTGSLALWSPGDGTWVPITGRQPPRPGRQGYVSPSEN